MKIFPLLFLVMVLLSSGCVKKVMAPVTLVIPLEKIDYLTEIQPILNSRCVVCHSCYNSPCQLKLSSYDGLDRGASKEAVYNSSRLKTMDPTRLFVDAHSTEAWRQKKFFSVTESAKHINANDSLMLQILDHKMKNPVVSGDYHAEAEDLTCAKDSTELGEYLDKHPNNGMPFGFPPLQQHEFARIAGWLAQGAAGPDPEAQLRLQAVAPADREYLDKWEEFFNRTDAKHIMTARYLYEHLFLAHIRFDSDSNAFYELVRSRTPPGKEIDIIATVRPYDDPAGKFFYRFRKIYSTIVYKTHMVFLLDDWQLIRFNQLFIEPEWLGTPKVMTYEPELSANPFVVFEQIPAKSRYQFLLDNAHYIIMTFIRGPVCKGQVALNVIDDHFWLMFLDPEADLTVRYPAFLKLHAQKLRIPSEMGSRTGLLKAINNPYHRLAMQYHAVRQDYYMSHNFHGMGYDCIWKGEKAADAPILTVYRHFDSASVHKGAIGNLPKTLWVVDYPLFERIYYSLVAGFDVYGNALHQLKTRLYMDALRREAESNFLDFMPVEQRQKIMKDWYQGLSFSYVHYHATAMPAGTDFTSDDPKREFVEYLIERHYPAEIGIHLDEVNYVKADEKYPELPASYRKKTDYIMALKALSRPGISFFTKVTDYNTNLAFIRIRIAEGQDLVISVVVNRWHDNVTFLFGEKNTLRPERDSADFIPGFVGAYPSYFFDIDIKDLPNFFVLLQNYSGSGEEIAWLDRFGINRSDGRFWEVYDWFQARFLASDPVNAGLFDLNRYYYRAM